jgi:DsbC/DsbD-like thiol-disulfide interchange protein
MRPIEFSLLAVLLPVLASALPAAAQVAEDGVASVDLLDGWRELDGTRVAGLAIGLMPGWHTYWRVPGEAGIPPRFDWSGSSNVESVAYEWPRPAVFEQYGMRSYGFAGALVLPLRIRPRDPAAPIELSLSLDFGVCADVCMSASARLAEHIAPDGAEEGRGPIEASLADRPVAGGAAGVSGATCALTGASDGYRLTAAVTFAEAPGGDFDAVLEPGQPGLWVGVSDSRTEGRTVIAQAPVETAGPGGPVLERRSLRVTLIDEDRAVEVRGCQPAEAASLR